MNFTDESQKVIGRDLELTTGPQRARINRACIAGLTTAVWVRSRSAPRLRSSSAGIAPACHQLSQPLAKFGKKVHVRGLAHFMQRQLGGRNRLIVMKDDVADPANAAAAVRFQSRRARPPIA